MYFVLIPPYTKIFYEKIKKILGRKIFCTPPGTIFPGKNRFRNAPKFVLNFVQILESCNNCCFGYVCPLVRSSVEWCATVEPRKTTCKAVLRCSCSFPRNGHKMPIYADTTTVKAFLSTVQHATFFGCITS